VLGRLKGNGFLPGVRAWAERGVRHAGSVRAQRPSRRRARFPSPMVGRRLTAEGPHGSYIPRQPGRLGRRDTTISQAESTTSSETASDCCSVSQRKAVTTAEHRGGDNPQRAAAISTIAGEHGDRSSRLQPWHRDDRERCGSGVEP
jgi:hypothetical protein